MLSRLSKRSYSCSQWGHRVPVVCIPFRQLKHRAPVKTRRMANSTGDRKTFNIAIEGCCHGELDKIYSTLQYLEEKENRKIDLLICCGDFQAVRNLDDLETMAVPQKYREIMTFYKYYSGEKVAPYPTIFIGGNHEAVNYLYELFYGGWAAPNIYFLGYSGVVRFGGHRIAGMSGTYSEAHYNWGHFEQPPYTTGSMRSAYHVRKLQTHKLMQLQEPVDVFVSHDWPLLITKYGDSGRLFARKPYFREEAGRDELGSVANQELLEELKPSYWFSAHLHVKFPAIVPHPAAAAAAGAAGAPPTPPAAAAGADQQQQGQEQQAGGPAQGAAAAAAGGGGGGAQGSGPGVTRFLALDKCLPGRDFLQVLELDVRGPLQLEYDPEWLAVLRSTHHLMSLDKYPRTPLPADWGGRAGPRPEDRAYVDRVLSERGGPAIPLNFQPTAPAYSPVGGGGRRQKGNMPSHTPRNPQTEALLSTLGLEYNLEVEQWGRTPARGGSQQQQQQSQRQGWGGGSSTAGRGPARAPVVVLAANPEEIALDDDDMEEEEGGEGEEGDGGAGAADGSDTRKDAAEGVGPPGEPPMPGQAVMLAAVQRATAVLAAAGVRVDEAGGLEGLEGLAPREETAARAGAASEGQTDGAGDG